MPEKTDPRRHRDHALRRGNSLNGNGRDDMNELRGLETRTTEQEDAELVAKTAEAQALEPELRAALVAEPDVERQAREAAGGAVDAETRERLELRSRATLGGFLLAALQGRMPSGVEAEYAASCKVTDGIPLDLFEQDRPAETREDAATPAPASGQGATLAPIQPFVFAAALAALAKSAAPRARLSSFQETG